MPTQDLDKHVEGMSSDLDLVGQIIGHRLQQGDIRRILKDLAPDARDAFTEKLADILRKTSALLEVSKRVSDTLSLDVLLPRMVQIVSEFLRADRCTLFLYDSDAEELYSRVAQGDLISEIRFPADKGIAGAVFKSGEALIIPDAYADPRFNQAVDKKTGYRTRNILAVPIRTSRSRTIGVAQVLNKHAGLSFSEDDLSLLEAITEQAASAFINAQLHEKIAKAQEEEAQLLEVTMAISRELQLLPLLQKIMETVTVILNADRSTLFMYDPKTKELWSHVAQGIGMAEIRFPCHLGIAGSVFTSSETINIPDAYADPRFNQEVDKKTGYKTNSILCMPVINKQGESIGVVQVLNKKGGPFSEQDERRLRAFGSQASIAIENARLFEDVMEMKNYNESILRSMRDGVLTFDGESKLVTANEAALRIFRSENTPEVMVDQPASAVLLGKNDWLVQKLADVRKTGAPYEAMDVDLWLRQGEGNAAGEFTERRRETASVNLSVVPLRNTKNEPIGCMLHLEDITTEKRLRGTMARYMSKELADQLMGEGEAVLGGKMQEATVLFTDIRSFTSISERLGATATVKMLNEYFSIMVDVIMEHGGILDKYIGDAIMAVFGAPFAGEEDADHAVQTAVGMITALMQFNEGRAKIGEEAIAMGVGINTDAVLSGNIGSLKRMDYTVIGDGVNLASRLEGANKAYGTQILISELTLAQLKGEYRVREVDKIRVKGKNEPVGVVEVLDYHTPVTFPCLPEILNIFGEGLAHYRQREFHQAEQAFQEAVKLNPNDGASRMYRDRCRYLREIPPEDDWDGVWTMTSK